MKITIGTYIRTACLALALINQILVTTGHSIIPIDDDTMTRIITDGFTIVTALIAWWKNNSFSQAALRGDAVMRELKG